MKLIIISGRSGSGKSTCLHVLEDLGYYCVDNIPASLLSQLAERVRNEPDGKLDKVAVSIDARNLSDDLKQFPELLKNLDEVEFDHQIIYLDADNNTLLKRFNETRRKHPLTNAKLGLMEAILLEKELLAPIASMANLRVDTSKLSLHQLRDIVKHRIARHQGDSLALQFQSFGFKHGLPVDADMVYDARCLPNPFWIQSLRSKTGLDQEVVEYLRSQPETVKLYKDIRKFLEDWLPHFIENNRSYITVAIGCTGGQHRSVFLCEELAAHFRKTIKNIQVRHKELM